MPRKKTTLNTRGFLSQCTHIYQCTKVHASHACLPTKERNVAALLPVDASPKQVKEGKHATKQGQRMK